MYLSSNKGFCYIKYNGNKCRIFGKGGVSRHVIKSFKSKGPLKKLKHALLARMHGVIDTLQYTATGPVLILAHTGMLMYHLTSALIFLPLICLSDNILARHKAHVRCVVGNFMSMVDGCLSLVLTPLEMIIPEIMVVSLEVQNWGLVFDEEVCVSGV
jgi:hypothetical protein